MLLKCKYEIVHVKAPTVDTIVQKGTNLKAVFNVSLRCWRVFHTKKPLQVLELDLIQEEEILFSNILKMSNNVLL